MRCKRTPEEIESKFKKVEADIFDLHTSLSIKNKRIDKMSCHIDNLEKTYHGHIETFHGEDSL